jgi:hypothetical protein
MKQHLEVVKGDLVELVRPGIIKTLSTGKKYEIVEASRIFGRISRVSLVCDDGKIRSFHVSHLDKVTP